MHLICEVEEAFDLQNCGCVIAPGIPVDFPYPVMRGAALVIESPTGQRLECRVMDFLTLKVTGALTHRPFSLQTGILKADVPRGSKVFLLLS